MYLLLHLEQNFSQLSLLKDLCPYAYKRGDDFYSKTLQNRGKIRIYILNTFILIRVYNLVDVFFSFIFQSVINRNMSTVKAV